MGNIGIQAIGFVGSILYFLSFQCKIIYDILVGSWAGILDEVVGEASMIISIARYGWKNLDKIDT